MKKYFKYIIISIYTILFIYLLFTNPITLSKLYIVIIVIILIKIYSLMRDLVFRKGGVRSPFRKIKNDKILIIIFHLFSIFLLIVNFHGFLIVKLHLILYLIIRYLNYRLNRYKFISKLIFYITKIFLFQPIFVIYYYIYGLMRKFGYMPIGYGIFRRLEGLIFNILIFSDVLQFITYNFSKIQIFFAIYCILLIIGLLSNYIRIYVSEEFNVDLIDILKIKDHFTINGRILSHLVSAIRDRAIKLNNTYIYSIYNAFKLDNKKCTKHMYIFNYVYNAMCLGCGMEKEVKYKPSYLIYRALGKEGLLYFGEVVLIVEFLEKVKDLKVNLEVKQLYEEYKYNIEQLLFCLWDIELHVNMNSYDILDGKNDTEDDGIPYSDVEDYHHSIHIKKFDLNYVKEYDLTRGKNYDYSRNTLYILGINGNNILNKIQFISKKNDLNYGIGSPPFTKDGDIVLNKTRVEIRQIIDNARMKGLEKNKDKFNF